MQTTWAFFRKVMGRTMAGILAITAAIFVFGAVAAAEPVVIQMIQFNRQQESDWQKAVVDRFNASRGDIQIELLAVPDIRPYEKALALLAAGIPPHISYGDPYHTISWGLDGIALNLEPYYARDVDDSDLRDFFPVVLDMHTIGEARYGIPIDLQVQAFFYAKVPFDEAGVAYPDSTWTWETVADRARQLTVSAADGEHVVRWGMRDPQWLHWWSLLWHFGGEMVDDPKRPAAFIGDSPQARAALEWMYDMIQQRRVMPPVGSVRGSTAVNMVVEETIAMAIGSSLYQQEANGFADVVPWDVTLLPSGPEGNKAFANSLGWVVYEAAGDHEEAWEVLKFFSSEEAMELAVEMRGTLVPHVPTTRDVWLFHHDIPRNRHVFIEAVNTAQAMPVLFDRGLDAVTANATAYWNGLLPLSQALENMRTGVDQWIARWQQ